MLWVARWHRLSLRFGSGRAGRKHGFDEATTDASAVFADPSVDAVVITTRHDSHARLVLQALESDKHVFVEKPLCLTLDELAVGVTRGRVDPIEDHVYGFAG